MALFETTNPHVTGFLGIDHFEPWHVNLEYAKFDQLNEVKAPIETLVIGSSTSEAFVPKDVEAIFGGNAYIVSLGGADTPSRMAVLKESLRQFKDLKRIIYVADFFEFNQPKAKPEVAFQKEMGALIPNYARPNIIEFCKYYLSNQSFEDVFNVLKRFKKDKRLIINSDGTMNQSMILSPLNPNTHADQKLSPSAKIKLNEQIAENYQTYSRSVLKDMKSLNTNVIELYREAVSLAKRREVKLNFILSPYHHDFRELLFKIPHVEKNYELWRFFLGELGEGKGVSVVDTTQHEIATEPMSGVWRDGIHYNRLSAMVFLKSLKAKASY